MKNNPFVSDEFKSIWLKHFNHSKSGTGFDFIKGLSFYKPTGLPLYINVGKNLTKGISYALNDPSTTGFSKKVFLIYDVPTYFDITTHIGHEHLKLYKIGQYPGFLIHLENYKDLSEYMTATFSKSSRYKLNKYNKRLEACFGIDYKMFHGNISKKEYLFIFEHFESLLHKRFLDKKITNNNLDPKEWSFYKEVAYPMILEKKASLFVIYNQEKPIAVTLNYLSDSILFDAITVFDIDYAKFHLGSITIMKQIEWCLENNISILDFSKGYFEYKTRWATTAYDFEYHIYYDAKSLKARVIAKFLAGFLKLKQFLREKEINTVLHKAIFMLKNMGVARKKEPQFIYEEVKMEVTNEKAEIINISDIDDTLRKLIFDFLYLHKESLKDIKLYSVPGESSTFILQGRNKQLKAKVLQV